MTLHEVWMEGYLASGMEGIPAPARLLAVVEADTFAEACDKLCSPAEWQARWGRYDRVRGTVWGAGCSTMRVMRVELGLKAKEK